MTPNIQSDAAVKTKNRHPSIPRRNSVAKVLLLPLLHSSFLPFFDVAQEKRDAEMARLLAAKYHWMGDEEEEDDYLHEDDLLEDGWDAKKQRKDRLQYTIGCSPLSISLFPSLFLSFS